MRRIATISCVLLLVLITGCGTPSSEPVQTNRVDMPKSYRYTPPAIEITVGTEVTWQNSDNFSHSVKFDQDIAPELVLEPGESGSIRFDKPGEYTYVCTFHAQQMKGKVIVRGE